MRTKGRQSKNIEDARNLAVREIGGAKSWLDSWADFSGATSLKDMERRMQEDINALNPDTPMASVRTPATDAMIEAIGRAPRTTTVAGPQQYTPSNFTGTGKSTKTAQIEHYIRDAAVKRGINPDTAVKVAKSEGLKPGAWQSNVTKNGKREKSFGPFQLNTEKGRLGAQFTKATGLDPRDPSTVEAQIDFALDHAAKHGWGSWYGAAKVGVANRQGLAKAKPIGIQAAPAEVAAAPAPGGLASFFADPLGMKAQAAEAPAGLAAYAAPEAKGLLGPTGYDPAKNPMNARVDAMFERSKATPALTPNDVFDGFTRPTVDTRQNFTGMSVPADTASPHTMANLGGLGGYLSKQQQTTPTEDRLSKPNVASFTPTGPLNADVYTPSTPSSIDPNAGYADPMGIAAAKEWGAKQAATVDPNTPETYAQQGEDRAGWQAAKEARNAAAAQPAPEMAYAPEATAAQGLGATPPDAAPQGLGAQPASPQGLGGITQAMNAVKDAASFAPPGGSLADMSRFAPNAAPPLSPPTDVANYSVAEAPTIADPSTESLNTFPEAPPAPTRMEAQLASMKANPMGTLAKAGLGFLTGGPLGLAMGLGGNLGMAGLRDALGNGGPGAMGFRDVGSVANAMGGVAGDTGYSKSLPGYGWAKTATGGLRFGKYGIQPTDAQGTQTGGLMSYDGGGLGGFLGGLFGGGKHDKDKAGKGLGGINGSGYSGKGLY